MQNNHIDIFKCISTINNSKDMKGYCVENAQAYRQFNYSFNKIMFFAIIQEHVILNGLT